MAQGAMRSELISGVDRDGAVASRNILRDSLIAILGGLRIGLDLRPTGFAGVCSIKTSYS